jgi:ferric-dicitrate binding protein FerR (iron transport regulator)
VDCEQSLNLLMAEMDREIQPEERTGLAQHLAVCADCRGSADAFRRQDADLRQVFTPRRRAVRAVADRVLAQLPSSSKPVTKRTPWLPILASAAAGFLLAVALFRPWQRTLPPADHQIQADNSPAELVSLAVANGTVERMLPRSNVWQVLKPGAEVPVGSRVRTGPSVRCEFRTAEGSEIRLNSSTELLFTAGRLLELAQGQMLTRVATAPTPFRVIIVGATLTAVGTEFDVLSQPAQSFLTVLEGSTRIDGSANPVIVRKGERAKIVAGKVTEKSQAGDLLQATRWVNEILIMKGRDNKELAARIDDLLAQIGESKTSYLSEQDIRALGYHCALPLTRFLESQRYQNATSKRHIASKILADLAQPWSIPDLIVLLRDQDGQVRYDAARALERLTRETFGLTPAQWRDRPWDKLEPTHKKWQHWWQDNKHLYPNQPETQ